MFTIDAGGPARCKIKSNASKEWSGTFRELERKKTKSERANKRIVERHQAQNGLGEEEVAHNLQQKEKLNKITKFLATHQEKTGSKGKLVKVILLIQTARKRPHQNALSKDITVQQ